MGLAFMESSLEHWGLTKPVQKGRCRPARRSFADLYGRLIPEVQYGHRMVHLTPANRRYFLRVNSDGGNLEFRAFDVAIPMRAGHAVKEYFCSVKSCEHLPWLDC